MKESEAIAIAEAPLDEQILAYLDEQLSPDQVADLESRLTQDSEARDLFRSYALMDAALRDGEAVDSDSHLVAGQFGAPSRSARGGQRSRLLEWAAVAACVVLGAALILVFGGRDADSTLLVSDEVDTLGVAMISAESNAVWETDSEISPTAGASLLPGRYTLREGLAQLDFFGGASVSLEAPAEIELIGREKAILHRGRLQADVPPAARGFEVLAGEVRVEDLGTRFGLSTDGSGSADLVVFDGEVKTHDRSGEAALFETGQGAILTEGEVTRLPQPDFQDYPELDEILAGADSLIDERHAKWRRWSAQQRKDPRLYALYDFEELDLSSRRLVNRATGADRAELDGGIVGARV
ncbi:MAG: FecR domain-containing protein, partial [Verrucomicrobiota bacterium]